MSQPRRTRRGTVSLPGRGAAASVVDEIRAGTPAVDTPAGPAGVTEAAALPVAPPPPPKRRTPAREQFSTKLPPQLIGDLRAFADHHQAEIQVVVELAIGEYLTSRGWETST